MPVKFFTSSLLLLLFSMLLWGCEKEETTIVMGNTPSVNPPQFPPIAYAGGDVWLQLPANWTTLFGSYSYISGTAFRYAWRQLSGPCNALISPKDSLRTSVSGLVKGDYSFEFTVTNSYNQSGRDTVFVYVQAQQLPPTNEIYFMNVPWDCPSSCTLQIKCISCYVPANKPFRVYMLDEVWGAWMELVTLDQMSVWNPYGYSIQNDHLFIHTDYGIPKEASIKIIY